MQPQAINAPALRSQITNKQTNNLNKHAVHSSKIS